MADRVWTMVVNSIERIGAMAPPLTARDRTKDMQKQRKLSHIHAALMGAAAALAAVAANRILNPGPYDLNHIAYWGGVAIGGALLGIAVVAIMARFRR